jgi:hypothetical protein
MGACDYQRTLPGKLTKAQLDTALRGWQREEEAENGHCEGYSGDSQTVREIKLLPAHYAKGMDEAGAIGLCLDRAEKYEFFCAVWVQRGKAWVTVVAGWAAC